MSTTKIQYIVIQKTKVNNIVSSNNNYENSVIGKLRFYPHNLLQFRSKFDFLDHIKSRDQTGIQVLFFTVDDLLKENTFDSLLQLLKLTLRVSVFFFSLEVQTHIKFFTDEIKKSKLPIFYYSIYDLLREVQVKDDKNYFSNHHEFYKLMTRDSKRLSKHISSKNKSLKRIELHPPDQIFTEIEYQHFKPIISNVINIYSADNITNISVESKWENSPLDQRQEIMIESLKVLDDMHRSWGRERNIDSDQYCLPTLILIFPFHNPLLSKLYKGDKDSIVPKILLAEQTDDYRHIYKNIDEETEGDKIYSLIEQITKNQTNIIDSIGYLHSSFQLSPVLRFPIKTSQLKQDVAIFGLSNRGGIVNSKKRHQLILKLGEKLNKTYLQEHLEEYLSQRNGQVFVISDLPMEWMLVKGVPLGFLLDVCRIQDSNIQGLINNYSAYSKINIFLGSSTVKKTLIIFSDTEKDVKDFSLSYQQAQLYQKQIGFSIALAKNALGVKQLIKDHRPQLLIFDCHCSFDREKKTSFLQIGDDKIYPENIAKLGIAAPIVFLASCHTNPNYDNVEKIHDAFFEAGALSVTGTYLPLDMDKGTFVYLRMLKLLNSQNERLASGNWLHFVSFAIRTSLVWELAIKCSSRFGRSLTKDEKSNFLSILKQLHDFEGRSQVFRQLSETGLTLSDELRLSIAETNLEFMYYSHYGRPDLIRFRD